MQTVFISHAIQASHPFLSNFSWFSWLFFPIFMVFMVIFFLKFMVFMVFWTQFKEFLVQILKLNFDVAKFLLKISYFARDFFWLFCSPQARSFDNFARRRRKFWANFDQKSLFSWFFWTNSDFHGFFMVFMVELHFHGFHGFHGWVRALTIIKQENGVQKKPTQIKPQPDKTPPG